MDAQRPTAEGASRPLSVPAGSYLDDEGVCFLPAFASGGLDCVRRSAPERRNVDLAGAPSNDLSPALEHDNLVLAEVTAREIGRWTRREA
jgi:hypothetical protein